MAYNATESVLNILKIQEEIKKEEEKYCVTKSVLNILRLEKEIKKEEDYALQSTINIIRMKKELKKKEEKDYDMYVNATNEKRTNVMNSIADLQKRNVKELNIIVNDECTVAIILLDFINTNGNNDAQVRSSTNTDDCDLGSIKTMQEWPGFDEMKMSKLRPKISWQIIDEETCEFMIVEKDPNPIDRIVIYKATDGKYYLSV
jgi:hypothetical protein